MSINVTYKYGEDDVRRQALLAGSIDFMTMNKQLRMDNTLQCVTAV